MSFFPLLHRYGTVYMLHRNGQLFLRARIRAEHEAGTNSFVRIREVMFLIPHATFVLAQSAVPASVFR